MLDSIEHEALGQWKGKSETDWLLLGAVRLNNPDSAILTSHHQIKKIVQGTLSLIYFM